MAGTPCTSDSCSISLDASGGELVGEVNIAGDPATSEWPYDCSAAEGNPLRCDPELGLWVPPDSTVKYVTSSQSIPAGVSYTTGLSDIQTAPILTLENDTCRDMFIMYGAYVSGVYSNADASSNGTVELLQQFTGDYGGPYDVTFVSAGTLPIQAYMGSADNNGFVIYSTGAIPYQSILPHSTSINYQVRTRIVVNGTQIGANGAQFLAHFLIGWTI